MKTLLLSKAALKTEGNVWTDVYLSVEELLGSYRASGSDSSCVILFIRLLGLYGAIMGISAIKRKWARRSSPCEDDEKL